MIFLKIRNIIINILKLILPVKAQKVLRGLSVYIEYNYLYRNKRLCYISSFDLLNPYFHLMKTALRKINIETVSDRYINFAEFLWFHWIEHEYENPDILPQIKKYKESGKKIIWNVHNRIPHEAVDIPKIKEFMKELISVSDKIIIHCHETIDVIRGYYDKEPPTILNKISYVPHPNYISFYDFKKSYNFLQNDKLSLCFFGKIRKYKNIELLILTLNELNFDDVTLYIYGKPSSIQYEQSLLDLIGNNNYIKTDFRFIDTMDIPGIIAKCHLFILPYNLDSSLNSGPTLLAFSAGRSVLSSQTGTLSDIEDKSLYFSYSYASHAEHKEALKEQIIAIREKYKGNYNELLKLGKKCKEYVNKNNSLELISKKIEQIFNCQ